MERIYNPFIYMYCFKIYFYYKLGDKIWECVKMNQLPSWSMCLVDKPWDWDHMTQATTALSCYAIRPPSLSYQGTSLTSDVVNRILCLLTITVYIC